MGDRNIPIKFGPEWLRNTMGERSPGTSNNQKSNSNPGTPVSSAPPGSSGRTGSVPSGASGLTSSSAPSGSPGGAAANTTGFTNASATSQLTSTTLLTKNREYELYARGEKFSSSGSGGASGSSGPTGSVPSGASGSSAPTGAPGGAAANTTASTNASATPTKTNNTVLLAKMRYGREEMLALYDRNAEAPQELRQNDTLYQVRGKQPVALNNTFEEDLRDQLRTAPPIGGISGDRFVSGRGAGRGVVNDGRGRSRGSYVRQLSTGRGANWHVGSPRMPAYSGGADDESGPSRPWANNNSNNRNSGDQPDWATKVYRNKRQGTNTNWRQPQTRDEGEEWRSSEPGRSRQHEKWDREWAERSSGDRPQNWNSNRRPWVGGDHQNNEENLPEWAGENAECGGTFDSSGAFHGYSNDDTNLPKHQDATYPLTRSHTHGHFSRPKVLEEGSEEWWASEKAKKLSPKRFDASDLKFKKQPGIGIADVANPSTNHKSNSSKEDSSQQTQETVETQAAGPEPPEANAPAQGEDKSGKQSAYKSNKFTESKTFDALMRSDINLGEASDERSNFQSVIINSNNSLRQKHQHLVQAMNETSRKQMQFQTSMKNNKGEMEHPSHLSPEDLIVDNIFGMSLDEKDMLSTSSSNSLMTLSSSGMSSGLASVENSMPQNLNMHISMSNSALSNQGMNMEMHMNQQPIQTAVIQPLHQSTGLQPGMRGGLQPGIPGIPGMPGMQASLQMPGMPANMQHGITSAGYPMQSPGMASQSMQGPRVQTPGMQPVLQNVGITNSALNASLGLPIGPNIGMPMQGMPQQIMPNDSTMGATGMGNMPRFPVGNSIPGMPSNVGNASLLFGQNSSNPAMSSSNEMPMSNHGGQNNIFHLHGMQHSGAETPFGNSIYSDNSGNLAEQWYYEDPERNIQGPFPSKDMYNWYRAGFFSPSLMVRRACETIMRPLGSYGPTVPFTDMEMMSPFPMSGGFERPQGAHENMLNSQATLALDVMNLGSMNLSDNPPMETLQYGSVGLTANQSFGQPQPMDSLWGQPSTSSDVWMQQPLIRPEVNNLPIFFWEQQPSAINSNSLLSEDITKEMKTEDQILAQLRASQNMGQPYMPELPAPTAQVSKPEDCYPAPVNATPNMEELHKLIQKDMLTGNVNQPEMDVDVQTKADKSSKLEQSSSESSLTKASTQAKAAVDLKQNKQVKDGEKSPKIKDNNTKTKTKKTKEDKKEEVADVKTKEEDVFKAEKRSQEPSPSKNKKEDKSNKKDLEKEKKEWIKEGFTIVKGSEKSSSKDNKKKAEEARVAEEAERKRKEEEKSADEDKKKKQAENVKKQQEQVPLLPQPRPIAESVVKKAPWSVVSNQAMQATNRDGLTLAEIQRLEREKKLEQMKEQQQMMQIIAQQQAAALAREQEMQAGLGWAKKKGSSNQAQLPTLTEIQAETRKQAAVAAAVAAATKIIEDSESTPPPQTNHAPWANTHNGGGFWDTPPNQSSKDNKQDSQKTTEVKSKKKPAVVVQSKKESSPAVEFETWCTGVLTSWSSKIDVPTFVGFLKDIESPYEIKDYVKCYLGESKESNDFARQFLERRSKLLRVGMVTPSDDLCSPAIAVNPRTTSGSDYQEVKGKGKKTKKNKMLKVDARILGFSVTAAEDRINVGDIDTV